MSEVLFVAYGMIVFPQVLLLVPVVTVKMNKDHKDQTVTIWPDVGEGGIAWEPSFYNGVEMAPIVCMATSV